VSVSVRGGGWAKFPEGRFVGIEGIPIGGRIAVAVWVAVDIGGSDVTDLRMGRALCADGLTVERGRDVEGGLSCPRGSITEEVRLGVRHWNNGELNSSGCEGDAVAYEVGKSGLACEGNARKDHRAI
jgi:hypothetical protein